MVAHNAWFNEFLKDIPELHIIYLKTDTETAYNRVIERNRVGETIPVDYLEQCNYYHNTWLSSIIFNDKHLLINGNDNLKPHIATNWISLINDFIHNLLNK